MFGGGRGSFPTAALMYGGASGHPQVFPAQAWEWTEEENKVFEASLVEFLPEPTDHSWEAIAQRIPGKTPLDVKDHYRRLVQDIIDIHAGIIQVPAYTDDIVLRRATRAEQQEEEQQQQEEEQQPARRTRAKPDEHKRVRPWTEGEHRQFVAGLETYGRGDWRSISRKAVPTRTPQQVASHAQKYFLRQEQTAEGKKKERRRSSIHDITEP